MLNHKLMSPKIFSQISETWTLSKFGMKPYEENSYEDTTGDVTVFMHEVVEGLIKQTIAVLESGTYLDNECVDFVELLDNFICLVVEFFIISSLIICSLLLEELVNWVGFIFNRLNLKKLDFVPLVIYEGFGQS